MNSKQRKPANPPKKRTQQKRKNGRVVVVDITPAQRAAKSRKNARRAQRRANSAKGIMPAVVGGQGGYFSENGGKLGSWIGNRGGSALGSIVDSVFGLGAYNVKQNSLVSMDSVRYQPGGPPRVINAKKGEATIFSHREFVSDVFSAAGEDSSGNAVFGLTSYSLNPGNSTLFPWLCLMAQGFQEYRVNGMLVELISESSTFAQNLALGSVMLAADYNPIAMAPVNKISMLELEYSSSCKTSDNIIMPIECAMQNDSETHLFIALDEDYMGTDARTFDLGTIYIATQGQPALSAKISELWVTYEIEMFKPKIPEASFGAEGAHWQLTSCTTASPLANANLQVGSTTEFSLNPFGPTITFPQGQSLWVCTIQWRGGVGSGYTPFSAHLVSGGELESYFSTALGADGANQVSQAADASVGGMLSFIVRGIDGQYTTISIVGGAFPVVSVRGDVFVARLPKEIVS
jgi:hypothetical protein